MDRGVKTKRLLRVMGDLGFEVRQIGSHAVLRHAETDTVVTVPADRSEVAPIFLKTVAQQVANTGLMSADAFNVRVQRGR